MKFTNKLPTKDLVRVYNSVYSIIDIEGICCDLNCLDVSKLN